MAKRNSPQEWQIARLELAFFDPHFDRWTLYQKLNGSHISTLVNTEEIQRSLIQQVLASAEITLSTAAGRIRGHMGEINLVPTGTNPNFYFCPCDLARHRQRYPTPRVVEESWGRILQYYIDVLDESGLSRRKTLSSLLSESIGSPEEVLKKCPCPECLSQSSVESPTPNSGNISHNDNCRTCEHNLSFDEGLQLVSILPIQRDWDLFGYWSKSKNDEFLSARLQILNDSESRSRAARILGYDVHLQLGRNGADSPMNEGDFFASLKFFPDKMQDDEYAAYLTYAAFIDELQPRLAPRPDGDSPVEYIVAYPIVVYGRTHLLQFRLVAEDSPDISELHRFWEKKVDPELKNQNLIGWTTRMLEQVAVEAFQFRVIRELTDAETIPVFSRKTLADIFCNNVTYLLPVEEVVIAESRIRWGYRKANFGRRWKICEYNDNPGAIEEHIRLDEYDIQIQLDSEYASELSPGDKDYLRKFLLQSQWRWLERYAAHMASSRSEIVVATGRNQSARFNLAKTVLHRVNRETKFVEVATLMGRLDALMGALERKEGLDRDAFSPLFEKQFPSVTPWSKEKREKEWSIADLFALPRRDLLINMPDECVEVIKAVKEAFTPNWRELMLRILNHPKPTSDKKDTIEWIQVCDWNIPPDSEVKTLKRSKWFIDFCKLVEDSATISITDAQIIEMHKLKADEEAELERPFYELLPFNEKVTWNDAPKSLLDSIGVSRNGDECIDCNLRKNLCAATGITLWDISLLHSAAVSNTRHAGDIKWFGYHIGNCAENGKKHKSQIELCWRFSKREENRIIGEIYSDLENRIKEIDEGHLGQNAEHIQDIAEIVCHRYCGEFYFSTGTYYIRFHCRDGIVVADEPKELCEHEEPAYYCVLK